MPTVNNGSVALYYETAGGEDRSLPAIVFAHGAGGNAAIWWQQVPAFTDEFRVVTFDHRGFARSRCNPEAFDPAVFADDLFAILDDAGVGRAVLVGQSMGGWTVVRAALKDPRRVRGIVLSCTPGGIAVEGLSEHVRGALSGSGGRPTPTAVLAPDFPAREPALAYLYAAINAFNPPLPPEALGRLFARDIEVEANNVASLGLPVLIFAGEHDPIFPPRYLRALAESLPTGRFTEIKGAGHSPYFEKAGQFNGILREFLGELERP